MNTVFQFRSTRFNCTVPKDFFINPNCYGDDVAEWLSQKLSEYVEFASPFLPYLDCDFFLLTTVTFHGIFKNGQVAGTAIEKLVFYSSSRERDRAKPTRHFWTRRREVLRRVFSDVSIRRHIAVRF